MAQLQHNMWVADSRSAVLSIITGDGKWVEMTIRAAPLYQHLLLTAEKKFWRCVKDVEAPRLFGVEPPRPRTEPGRIDDRLPQDARCPSEAWMHQGRSQEMVPEDAREAFGHRLRAKCSKSGPLVLTPILTPWMRRAPMPLRCRSSVAEARH